MPLRRASRRGRAVPLAWAAIALLGVFALLSGTTQAGWTNAAITNSANETASGTVAYRHTPTGGTACDATAADVTITQCIDGIAPLSSLTTTSASRIDTIRNTGTARSAGLTQKVSAASCAPVRLDDARGTSPLLVRNKVTFQRTDKWGGTDAMGFNGSPDNGMAADVAGSSGLFATRSVGIWFKSATGGTLMSASASPANKAVTNGVNMLLWMDGTGKLRFWLANTFGTARQGGSTAAYNNGAWHFAVLSVGAFGEVTLYVDNAPVASSGANTGISLSTMYWHVGWGDFAVSPAATNPPASPYFKGELSAAFHTPSTVSSTQVNTLYTAANIGAFQTTVLGLALTSHFWSLGDTGTYTHTGTMPSSMTAPCGRVNLTLQFANPTDTTITNMVLSTFANGATRTVAAPDAATDQSLTVTLSRGATYNTDITGLHLLVPLTFSLSASTDWTATMQWNDRAAVFYA